MNPLNIGDVVICIIRGGVTKNISEVYEDSISYYIDAQLHVPRQTHKWYLGGSDCTYEHLI